MTSPMKIVIALDSFKECLPSAAANVAAARGVAAACPEAEVLCRGVSDGGEGWLDACRGALGGEWVTAQVHDPLMRPIQASYLVSGGIAILESARVCGLQLVAPTERDPLAASTYGLGELVADAWHRGYRQLLVGLGGSATSDAGRGMLHALEEHCPEVLAPGAPRLEVTLAADVSAPLCGPTGASLCYSPQKGASPQAATELESQTRRFAADSAARLGFDRSCEPGAGAAGGLGYAFLQFFGATLRSGAGLLLDMLGFDRIISGADWVITGEGASDAQTLMGKVPFRILERARRQGVRTALLAGRIADREALLQAGFDRVLCINPPGLPAASALDPAVASGNIQQTVQQLFT